MTDEQIISAILKREGGFVDNPADKGGPTNHGITMPTLAEWRGKNVTEADIRTLTEREARDIYKARYVVGPRFHLLADHSVRAVVVDCGVHHGPANAIRMLQRALGVKADGVLGIVTLTAANTTPGHRLALRVLADRVKFFGRLISKDLTDDDQDGIPDNTEFAAGWLNRVAEMIEEMA